MRLAIGVLITTALLNHSAGIPRFPTFWSPRASKLFLSRYLSETVRCQSCYNYNGQACVSNPDCYGEFCLFGSCTSIDGPCSNVYSAKNCQMYSFFFVSEIARVRLDIGSGLNTQSTSKFFDRFVYIKILKINGSSAFTRHCFFVVLSEKVLMRNEIFGKVLFEQPSSSSPVVLCYVSSSTHSLHDE